MGRLSLWDRITSFSSKKSQSRLLYGSRRPLMEMLEARHMLTVSFPGNFSPPDLDLSEVDAQTVTAGQLLTLNLTTAGATVEDLDDEGEPTGDTILYYLDPDVGTDTPTGAALTTAGVFTWTPTAAQIGTHRIIVIAVDGGTPALADAEVFIVNVIATTPAAVVDLNGADAGTGFSSTFVEDGGAKAIVDTDLTVTDADDTNLESATITLTNRPDGEDESLAVTVTGTPITQNYNATTGVLTLSGTATVAEYQQVLRTLTYNNISQAPDTTTRTVNVVVNDGTSNSTPAVATITIQGANDAPSVDLNGGDSGTGFAATYTEDGAAVAIVGANATIGDVDSAILASATITITAPLNGSDELLAVVTTGTNITANYVAATGVLTLSGNDTLTNYQQVLRTLTYASTSQNPSATRTIQVVVNDGSNNSTARTSTVTITSSNDAPNIAEITDKTATVGVPFQVIVTATDPDNDNLTYQLDGDDPEANMPASAIITKNNNNEAVISWTPSAADGTGPFTFVVLVTDDDGTPLTDREEFAVTIVTAAPVVDLNGAETGTGFTASFTEGGTPTAIVADEALTVTDTDSANLASATVTITNLQDGDAEILAVNTTGTPITANYNAATGVLSLTGSATLANYQQVLRTLTYNNTSQDPTEVNRSITVVVNDGANSSTAATATVSVAGVNDGVGLALPAPYDNSPVEITLGDDIEFTAIITDPDNTLAEITVYLDTEELPPGSVEPTIDGTGLFQWTPDTIGTFTITIIAIDSPTTANTKSFTIIVNEAVVPEEESLDTLDAAFASLI